MKKFFVSALLISIVGIAHGQKAILLWGQMSDKTDTACYYFENNPKKIYTVVSDNYGNYKLALTNTVAKSVIFYFKSGNKECQQTLSMEALRDQIKKQKDNNVRNDLMQYKGFACVRAEPTLNDEARKYMGVWISDKKQTLNLEGYYKFEYVENGVKVLEEGEWTVAGAKLVLSPIYRVNAETNAIETFTKKHELTVDSSKNTLNEGKTEFKKKN